MNSRMVFGLSSDIRQPWGRPKRSRELPTALALRPRAGASYESDANIRSCSRRFEYGLANKAGSHPVGMELRSARAARYVIEKAGHVQQH